MNKIINYINFKNQFQMLQNVYIRLVENNQITTLEMSAFRTALDLMMKELDRMEKELEPALKEVEKRAV